ncbi:exopolysaccharide production protein YjbE [Escherichia coli]|nr:exopolysaccharide production protein YjbE [Escherichia coli]MCW3279268.1 exopolysaccharide production protein YjbE [Escherichia coli]
MKKVLYGIFAISALAATSAWAAPVQVGEAAGSAATSVSAGVLRDQRQHRKLGGGCRARGNRWR